MHLLLVKTDLAKDLVSLRTKLKNSRDKIFFYKNVL